MAPNDKTRRTTRQYAREEARDAARDDARYDARRDARYDARYDTRNDTWDDDGPRYARSYAGPAGPYDNPYTARTMMLATNASADTAVLTMTLTALGTVLQSLMNLVQASGERYSQSVSQSASIHTTHLATTAAAANRVLYAPVAAAAVTPNVADRDSVRVTETIAPLSVY
ncbi:MAG TPA: hypothetical protein VGG48_00775 [Rhizomicrobium sp.]|jgi:hypothetical protein